MRLLSLAVPAAAAVAALGVLAGPAVSATHKAAKKTTDVSATEVEFKITLTHKSAPAGKVEFTVKNDGKLTHQFIVLRTTKAAGSLPVHGATVQLSKAGHVMGQLARVEPGKTMHLTVDLTKARYVILCNMPGHYKAGQYTTFDVT
jgi:uncharacterized cupredoxin-like copper-binding protein